MTYQPRKKNERNSGFVVPYVCPVCKFDRWVDVGENFGGTPVVCPNCGKVGRLKGPTE